MPNTPRLEAIAETLTLAISREPGIEARVLARAVVSLVESRGPEECLAIANEIGLLAERFPRKAVE